MIKTIISLTRRLASSLNRILSWLESKDCSADIQAKFVDLAPTDKADKAGIYSEAILFAMNNVKVFNISLTGPYGSGKSSIIKSFLKRIDALRFISLSLHSLPRLIRKARM